MGVVFNRIEPAVAIPACKKALAESKDVARFAYQLGRAYLADRDFDRARSTYMDAIELGSDPAVLSLARLLILGQGGPQDNEAAFRLVEGAAARGFPDAVVRLSYYYTSSIGVPYDETKSFEWAKRAAALNSTAGMRRVAEMHWNGFGTEKNRDEANRWYRASNDLELPLARSGDVAAMRIIGRALLLGEGVDKEYDRGLSWTKLAADAGDDDAMFDLAYAHQNGWGLPVDHEEGCRWYEKAAQYENSGASNNLGVCYAEGRGRPHDDRLALQHYLQASALGNANAARNAGRFYLNGIGTLPDAKRAFRLFQLAAERGLTSGFFDLARLYESGRGVEADVKSACDWYEKAANRGDAAAMNNFGVCFASGEGRPVDLAVAHRWYERSSAAGDSVAARNLGDFYSTGTGVTRDTRKAAEWYGTAAERGDFDAMARFAHSLLHGIGIAKNTKSGADWMRRAAEGKSIRGMYGYAILLDEGKIIKADARSAASWLLKAFEAGHSDALVYFLSSPESWAQQTRREIALEMKRRDLYSGTVDGTLNAELDTALWDKLLLANTPAGSHLVQEFVRVPEPRTKKGILVRLCRSQDAAANARSLVVINHGLTSKQSERVLMRPYACGQMAKFFVARGYTVAMPLRRGYGETGGETDEVSDDPCGEDDPISRGLNMAKDIAAVVKHLQGRPDIKTGSTIVAGHSGGGWGSLAAASKNLEGVAGYINVSGTPGSAFGKPDGICGSAPIVAAAAKYGRTARTPMLWLYVDNDSLVGPKLAKRAHEAFTKAGGNAELIVLPPYGQEGHNAFTDGAVDTWGPVLDGWLGPVQKQAQKSLVEK